MVALFIAIVSAIVFAFGVNSLIDLIFDPDDGFFRWYGGVESTLEGVWAASSNLRV